MFEPSVYTLKKSLKFHDQSLVTLCENIRLTTFEKPIYSNSDVNRAEWLHVPIMDAHRDNSFSSNTRERWIKLRGELKLSVRSDNSNVEVTGTENVNFDLSNKK